MQYEVSFYVVCVGFIFLCIFGVIENKLDKLIQKRRKQK